MKKKLRIYIVQTDVAWQNKQKNFALLSSKIENTDKADIIILPEMFNTGFNINPHNLAEDFNGPTIEWMKTMASKTSAAIAGSLIFHENGKYYNRFVMVTPKGKIAFYDKRHSFSMAGENKFFAKGNTNVIINYLGWKIKPLVCYDLRFPVWARNRHNYHLLIYVANWPDSRIDQWKNLLLARAIENQTYTIGVNRIGSDGNGFYYSGLSLIINPKGQIIYQAPLHHPATALIELDMELLEQMRKKFPVLNDKDQFSIPDEQLKEFYLD